MKRWLRHHQYAMRVALRRLANQPFSTLANIFVISLSLAVPLVAASVLVTAQPVVRTMPVSAELTLLLSQETSLDQARTLAKSLDDDYAQHIQEVSVIERDDALDSLRDNPAWAEALAVLPDNPLPHAVVVTLRDDADQASVATSLASQWRDLTGVDAVQLDADWVRRLQAILQFLRIGLGLLAAAVVLVVVATVFNTVRMQALTQREEISVARLVGATESFVRRPFLYLGAITGLISGLVAIGVAAAALVPLNHALHKLAATYQMHVTLHLPHTVSLASGLLIVVILGAVAARWSVTRNTRF